MLLSPGFVPTKVGTRHEIAILPGEFFKDEDRITGKIRAVASEKKLTTPHPEVACLVRDQFTDENIEHMGLVWIIVMHEPIKDSVGDLRLLGVDRDAVGRRLYAYYVNPDLRWNSCDGFAFAVSQV